MGLSPRVGRVGPELPVGDSALGPRGLGRPVQMAEPVSRPHVGPLPRESTPPRRWTVLASWATEPGAGPTCPLSPAPLSITPGPWGHCSKQMLTQKPLCQAPLWGTQAKTPGNNPQNSTGSDSFSHLPLTHLSAPGGRQAPTSTLPGVPPPGPLPPTIPRLCAPLRRPLPPWLHPRPQWHLLPRHAADLKAVSQTHSK